MFKVVYELDCTVAEAAAAYLDVEHYAYLHQKYASRYDVFWQDGHKAAIAQTWKLGPFVFGNSCITEYVPPARFRNYDLKPVPAWLPSIHHLIKTETDLRYLPTCSGQRTISDLTVTLDIPWWLWPLRKFIQNRLTRLKIEKDQEDVDMIAETQRLFGRGNLKHYLRKDVFLLHKDTFAEYFAGTSELD